MKNFLEENQIAERRAYKRIAMKDVSFSCRVIAEDRICKVVSLSLSGGYMECPVKMTVGETCEVVITSQDPTFNTPLSLSARVVRLDEKGVALEFCNTGDKDYMMLQTVLLYHSDEPHAIAAEFPATSNL